MVARNDVTGDAIQSKSSSQAYRDNWDAIFGKKKLENLPISTGQLVVPDKQDYTPVKTGEWEFLFNSSVFTGWIDCEIVTHGETSSVIRYEDDYVKQWAESPAEYIVTEVVPNTKLRKVSNESVNTP